MGKKRREKFRGYRTHGRGKKAGRGKGKRGGCGNAGLHKHKFMYVLKYEPDHFGRRGFSRHPSLVKDVRTINLHDIEENIERFASQGFAKLEGNTWHIDLVAMGYDKLLGTGKANFAMKIKVPSASERAIEKVEEAGGSVLIVGHDVGDSGMEDDADDYGESDADEDYKGEDKGVEGEEKVSEGGVLGKDMKKARSSGAD